MVLSPTCSFLVWERPSSLPFALLLWTSQRLELLSPGSGASHHCRAAVPPRGTSQNCEVCWNTGQSSRFCTLPQCHGFMLQESFPKRELTAVLSPACLSRHFRNPIQVETPLLAPHFPFGISQRALVPSWFPKSVSLPFEVCTAVLVSWFGLALGTRALWLFWLFNTLHLAHSCHSLACCYDRQQLLSQIRSLTSSKGKYCFGSLEGKWPWALAYTLSRAAIKVKVFLHTCSQVFYVGLVLVLDSKPAPQLNNTA